MGSPEDALSRSFGYPLYPVQIQVWNKVAKSQTRIQSLFRIEPYVEPIDLKTQVATPSQFNGLVSRFVLPNYSSCLIEQSDSYRLNVPTLFPRWVSLPKTVETEKALIRRAQTVVP